MTSPGLCSVEGGGDEDLLLSLSDVMGEIKKVRLFCASRENPLGIFFKPHQIQL